MWKDLIILSNKIPNINKAISYGFIKEDNKYVFHKEIMKGMFILNVYINNDKTEVEVIDAETNEEYNLVYIKLSVGSFIGEVKSECESILSDIVNKCYEPNYFKYEYTKLIIEYIKRKYSVEAEYLWGDYIGNAVFRENNKLKWFGVLLKVEKYKLGLEGNDIVEVINLTETIENIEKLIDMNKYFPGFHMNKKHWYTINLDSNISIEDIYNKIDISYNLVLDKNRIKSL